MKPIENQMTVNCRHEQVICHRCEGSGQVRIEDKLEVADLMVGKPLSERRKIFLNPIKTCPACQGVGEWTQDY